MFYGAEKLDPMPLTLTKSSLPDYILETRQTK